MIGHSECSQTSLGKVSNAAVSLTSHSRKTEAERPLSKSVTHVRVESGGSFFILEGTAEGWTAVTKEGVFVNPWKNRPFSTKESARHAIRYRLKRGRWPTAIGNPKREPEAGKL